MNKHIILLLIFSLIKISLLSAQAVGTVEINPTELTFTKYQQISFGAVFNGLNGNITDYVAGRGGGNMDISFTKGKYLYGINMDFVVLKKNKDFTTPAGYEHYKQPSILTMGLHFGIIQGKHQNSHNRILIGAAYTSIYHKKKDKCIETYDGVSPYIEFSRMFRISGSHYSEMQYTGTYSEPRYDPTISYHYLGLFIGYRRLIMNNKEGNGNMLCVGLRFTMNRYSIGDNAK